MAIGTYGQLKTAVASWLHRTDLTSVIPDFIALAESTIRKDIRCRAMEQTATGTLASSSLAFPTRFASARRVLLGTSIQNYVTPNVWYDVRNDVTDEYTIVGEAFQFQSASSTYQIDYWQYFASFSDDGDTNSLLTNNPEIYLAAALVEAHVYIKADPSYWLAKYQSAAAALKASENKFAGPMAIKPVAVV